MITDFVFNPNMNTVILVGVGAECEWIKLGMEKLYPTLEYILCDRRFDESQEEGCINYSQIEQYSHCDFIISSSKYAVDIYKTLKKYGVLEENVHTAVNVYLSAFDVMNDELDYLYKKINYPREIRKLYAFLEEGWDVMSMDMLITERCSLNCKYCCALMPEYAKPVNFGAEDFIEGFDNLLSTGCYLGTLSFIGGEPLLNQKVLCEILRHYKDNRHILTFQIITNGTLMPSDELLNTLNEIKSAYVIFSNYGELSRKMQEAAVKFQEYGIQVAIEKEEDISAEGNNLWLDYGKVKKYEHSPAELQKMYDNCLDGKYCFSILKNKLYICNRIAHGINLGLIPTDGYRTELDLSDLAIQAFNSEKFREKCEEFLYANKAPEGCMYCNRGAGLLGVRAEQKERIKG